MLNSFKSFAARIQALQQSTQSRPRVRIVLQEQEQPEQSVSRIRVALPKQAVEHKKSSVERGGQTFSKVFRWQMPKDQAQPPESVEVVGSFTHWQRVPLTRPNPLDGWLVTLPHIPAHRTHHYMLLVDGKPVFDENADGLAVPRGPHEEQYQLQTTRGGRVLLLYAQTK